VAGDSSGSDSDTVGTGVYVCVGGGLHRHVST
jgi:hypothetical protein